MIEPRSWIPADTRPSPRVSGLIEEMVEQWSSAWFATSRVRMRGEPLRVTTTVGELRKWVRRESAAGVALAGPPSLLRRLGALALGVSSDAQYRAADLAVIEDVGNACRKDLEKRSARLFGIDDAVWQDAGDGSAASIVRVQIGVEGGEPLLQLEMTADRFAAFVKQYLPPLPLSDPLGDATPALDALPLALSAMVGNCDVTVAELSGLAAGDILILDRDAAAALPLAADGQALPRGSCTLVPGERFSLEIVESPSGCIL